MPPLKGDEEEIKEEKWFKILTLNKLVTGLPIILAQKNWKEFMQIKKWN